MTPTIDSDTGEIVDDAPQEPGRALVHRSSPDLERREAVAGVLRPVERPDTLLEAQEETRSLIAEVLQEDRDYGQIPGTDRKTLLQPGAQRVASAFGCAAETEIVESEVDHDRVVHWEKKRKKWEGRQFAGWERETGTSIGLYRYVARCRLVHRGTGVVVGEGLGICSSLEDRYVDRPRDLEHTIMRMASKRALINAVLQTFSLSEQFQDVEEAKEERAELPIEEQIKIARGRYHAVLAELLPDERTRARARAAFQEAHPVLPDSSAEWELQHFRRAIGELEKHGARTFERAVAWKAEQDPARPVDLDLFDSLRTSGRLPADELEFLDWIRGAGVSSWIVEELRRVEADLDEEASHDPSEPPEETEGQIDDLPF